MKAKLTSKGQITIPIAVRERLRLKTGDVLEFDEEAPFLKATKTIPPGAWDVFASEWNDPFPTTNTDRVLDELRGSVELPPSPHQP